MITLNYLRNLFKPEYKVVYMLGCGGHARELARIGDETGNNRYVDIIHVTPKGTEQIHGREVISETEFVDLVTGSNQKWYNAILGIGSPKLRAKIVMTTLRGTTAKFPTLIHPSVLLIPGELRISAYPGNSGVVICKGVNLTTNITLEQHVHLNTGCTVCHDVRIGEFSTISPGAVICGNVTIGRRCYIGAGAVIKDGVSIAHDVTVGAGAVVVKDIVKPGTYVGTPANFLKDGSL